MKFDRKITLYLNKESGITKEHLMDAVIAARRGNHFLVQSVDGRFEAFCDCGFADCANRKPEVK